ncbi:hypothetical protein A5724_19300 [Mycobacterium sp. ACS1612]|uniref:phage tail sheath subtilisin-like domain-containing protein n=1 Tax=Mycobacterium sp. ACS1612 TaxID=1834117 RepID=UPI0007FCC95D|nr:phage tail sheath subtilisin-like domain-containing protein [Mycobacterium sp. ACS1612]OBF33698.1 hypothetical protein A5724_19300 [Mycobacterium sp. ACS1612]
MFATDQAPGVYYQTVDAGSPPVEPLRTDITAIIGIAERGPMDMPVPVESWQQFVSWFGGCTPSGYLAYAVRGFLENGGRRCWVVRVASNDPLTGSAAASALLRDAAGPVWRVSASSHGVWGNQLSVVMREVNRAQLYTVAQDPAGRWSEVPSVAGLARSTLVRATQSGTGFLAYRTVATTDAVTSRVYWTHPDPGAGLPYDAPLTGVDPDQPVLLETVDYRMLAYERGRLLRMYDRLSLVPEHPRYGPTVLAPTAAAFASPEPVVLEELRSGVPALTVLDVVAGVQPLSGARDGLASLTVGDFVGEPFADDDSDEARARKRRGLRAVADIDEVGLLAVPDIHIHPAVLNEFAPPPPCVPDPCLDDPPVEPAPPVMAPPELPPVFTTADVYRVQAEMVLQCEQKRDRFALLDVPHEVALDAVSGIRGVLDWRARFDTDYAALNYPWLKVSDPIRAAGAIRLLPASGHVAGIVAATDLEHGVHRAPANRRIDWALGPSAAVSEERHAVLNQAGVNVARSADGRGLRLLGARTMSSDPDWVFINVRRLVSMIEKALGNALQWAVFEPNGFLTRARATMTATFFLDTLHEAGMLAGASAEESFFVHCDLNNNPPEQRDVGQLLMEIGIAPAQPFEFVVLRVGRVHDSIQVRGASTALGATGTGF